MHVSIILPDFLDPLELLSQWFLSLGNVGISQTCLQLILCRVLRLEGEGARESIYEVCVFGAQYPQV